MKRLWVHEILRVYGDRLVDEIDMSWLIKQMRKTLNQYMDDDMNKLFRDFTGKSADAVRDDNSKKVLHFLTKKI